MTYCDYCKFCKNLNNDTCFCDYKHKYVYMDDNINCIDYEICDGIKNECEFIKDRLIECELDNFTVHDPRLKSFLPSHISISTLIDAGIIERVKTCNMTFYRIVY